MKVTRLDIEGLRCVSHAQLRAGDGLQFLVGANGAGKTTVLEAMHLLGYGRSFRSGLRDAVIQRGADASVVFAEIARDREGQHRVGLRRGASDWTARIDESEVASLIELFRVCPVVCFEPGSHALIAGAAEQRRAFLDWSVFHVEPGFLGSWRRHQRALRQRNAGLRAGWADALLAPWEIELSDSAVQVSAQRERVLHRLGTELTRKSAAFLPELGNAYLRINNGFGDRDCTIVDEVIALYQEARDADRERGFTRFGAHRADWSLSFDAAPRREHLSRGQEKLAALAMVLAQVEHFRLEAGEWPLLLLDDLASELDAEHLRRVLDWIFETGLQAWVTGTAVPNGLSERPEPWSLFHVEQGWISPA